MKIPPYAVYNSAQTDKWSRKAINFYYALLILSLLTYIVYCSVMLVRDNWNCGRGAQRVTAPHDVTNDLIFSLELVRSSLPGCCISSSFTNHWTLGELIIHKLVQLLFVCYNDTLKMNRRLSHFNGAGTISSTEKTQIEFENILISVDVLLNSVLCT